ncbi:hypothetical protein ABZV31_29160 [Streptomyces sp. NPDC005202]|uniref:hypothetical protein n=1 Tax=Streptomyces sp. NPDC005202 TaxID=3157021 RepID=UPI0033A21AB5
MLHTLFVTPPLATVGLTDKQARAAGHRLKIARQPVAEIIAMPRAYAVEEARGVISGPMPRPAASGVVCRRGVADRNAARRDHGAGDRAGDECAAQTPGWPTPVAFSEASRNRAPSPR